MDRKIGKNRAVSGSIFDGIAAIDPLVDGFYPGQRRWRDGWERSEGCQSGMGSNGRLQISDSNRGALGAQG